MQATVDSLGRASARSFGPVTIDGKVVAITGASSGIGEATAALLAERGARLVLGARNAEQAECGGCAAVGGRR